MAKKATSLTQAAIPVLKSVVSKKSIIPILQYVLVIQPESDNGAVSMAYGTDLDTWVEVRVNDHTAPGLYIIIGKELVPANDRKVADFPVIPAFVTGGPSVRVPVETIKQTIPYISREISRYTLNAMLLTIPSGTSQPIVTAGTDGYRLRVQYVQPSEDFTYTGKVSEENLRPYDYLITSDVCRLISKLVKSDTVQIDINSKDANGAAYVRVKTEAFTVYGRKLSGPFANWQAVLSRDMENQVAVNREELITNLEVLKPFTNERTGSMQIEFEEHSVILSATRDGYSRRIVQLKTNEKPVYRFDAHKFLSHEYRPSFSVVMPMRGSDPKILSLNIAYLLDAARTTTGEWLHIGYKDAQSSVSFSGRPLSLGETATAEEIADIQASKADARAEAIRVAREMAVAHPEEAETWNSKADHLETTAA